MKEIEQIKKILDDLTQHSQLNDFTKRIIGNYKKEIHGILYDLNEKTRKRDPKKEKPEADEDVLIQIASCSFCDMAEYDKEKDLYYCLSDDRNYDAREIDGWRSMPKPEK